VALHRENRGKNLNRGKGVEVSDGDLVVAVRKSGGERGNFPKGEGGRRQAGRFTWRGGGGFTVPKIENTTGEEGVRGLKTLSEPSSEKKLPQREGKTPGVKKKGDRRKKYEQSHWAPE